MPPPSPHNSFPATSDSGAVDLDSDASTTHIQSRTTRTHISADYVLKSLASILATRPPGLEDAVRLQSHGDLAKLQRLQAKQIKGLAAAIRRQGRKPTDEKTPAAKVSLPSISRVFIPANTPPD